MTNPSNAMDRKLLILDLDDTLILASETRPEHCDFDFVLPGSHFWVRKRPHLDEFLRQVSTRYDLAVWSASSADYVKEVVRGAFGDVALRFAWSGERCVRKVFYSSLYDYACLVYKPLSKLFRKSTGKNINRYDKARVLIVDDNPTTYARNYGNAIPIRAWTGDASDTTLLDLSRYLLSHMVDVPDVRRVEKRHWRLISSRGEDQNKEHAGSSDLTP